MGVPVQLVSAKESNPHGITGSQRSKFVCRIHFEKITIHYLYLHFRGSFLLHPSGKL